MTAESHFTDPRLHELEDRLNQAVDYAKQVAGSTFMSYEQRDGRETARWAWTSKTGNQVLSITRRYGPELLVVDNMEQEPDGFGWRCDRQITALRPLPHTSVQEISSDMERTREVPLINASGKLSKIPELLQATLDQLLITRLEMIPEYDIPVWVPQDEAQRGDEN